MVQQKSLTCRERNSNPKAFHWALRMDVNVGPRVRNRLICETLEAALGGMGTSLEPRNSVESVHIVKRQLRVVQQL